MKKRLLSSPPSKASSTNLPSKHLDLEISNSNCHILATTASMLIKNAEVKRSILKDAGGDGPTQKLATRKLNAIGIIKAHCGIVNDDATLAKMKRQLELAKSISEINVAEKKQAEKKRESETQELIQAGPDAVKKLLSKGRDVSKLIKKEICAVLLTCFGVFENEKNKKPLLVSALENKIREFPNALSTIPIKNAADLPSFVEGTDAAAAAAAPPEALAVPALPEDNDDEYEFPPPGMNDCDEECEL